MWTPRRYFQKLSVFDPSNSSQKPPLHHLLQEIWEIGAAMRRQGRMRASEKAVAGLSTKVWSENGIHL